MKHPQNEGVIELVEETNYIKIKVLKMSKRTKFDKRRAIDCKLLKRSATHDGYCKYIVTIGEKDGTVNSLCMEKTCKMLCQDYFGMNEQKK